MSTKSYTEQIVNLLRQIEVEIANRKATLQTCQNAEITAQTYYRSRKEFNGLNPSRVPGIPAGLGATKPIDSNDTPQGRAQNRRVEFVKQ